VPLIEALPRNTRGRAFTHGEILQTCGLARFGTILAGAGREGRSVVTSQASTQIVLATLAASLILTFALFAAAGWSGSSAMLAVAIQVLIGASSQGLLLYGLKKAAVPGSLRPASRDLFFWSFAVPALLLSLGSGIAMSDGVAKLAAPLPPRANATSYAVLAVAFVVLAALTQVAAKRLARPCGTRQAPRSGQDPALSTIVIEGLAALLGIAIAAAGLIIAKTLSVPAADGYAAIAIGLLLGVVAAFLALEIRTLLAGAAAPAEAAGSSMLIEDDLASAPPVHVPSAAPAEAQAVSVGPTSGASPLSRKARKRQKGRRA